VRLTPSAGGERCFAPGVGVTRHPKLGAVERRPALSVNFLWSRHLRKVRRSGALQGAVR
jgi:hypothetical protein